MRLIRTSIFLLALTTLGVQVGALDSADIADANRQQRLAAAQPTELFAPGLVVSNSTQVELLIVSRVSYELDIEVAALDALGKVVPLDTFQLSPHDHLRLPLTEALAAAEGEFDHGSIRVSYLGDSEMLQAWLLTREENRVIEAELQNPAANPTSDFLTFWDTASTHGAKPNIFLLNAGSLPITVVATTHPHHEKPRPRKWLLEAGQAVHWQPSPGRGWAKISHDGLPGTLLVAGRLTGKQFLGSLPVFEDLTDARVLREETSWYSLPAPLRIHQGDSLNLLLFNSTDSSTSVDVTLRAAETQEVLFQNTLDLSSRDIQNLPLHQLSAVLDPRTRQEVRITVSSSKGGILTYGFSRTRDTEVVDLTFFPRTSAHDGGIYPLFPLESHETYTNLVNLGAEASTVVAQFWWPRGTYSLGPVTIAPGATYRLDVNEIAMRQEPDLLGRTLDPELQSGLFRWRVHHGSRTLLGRTEIRRKGSRDSFGLNCLACCHETPSGTIVPSSIDFLPGQIPAFQACVTYNTCVGTEGPFPTIAGSIHSPVPFIWNGSSISASGAAKEEISFTSLEEGMSLLCRLQAFPIEGIGTANTCKQLLRKPHDPENFWNVFLKCTQQLGNVPSGSRCSSCNSCCNQILAWKQCTKTGLLTANSDHQACLTNCATELGCN